MAYPSLEQYNEALQSPQFVLQDPELKQGKLKTTGLGLPLALCGGFALTYTVTVGAKKFALRCFHKESRELERRYQAISARLKQLNSPYFLPFEFNPNGIRIQGNAYPIVKMAWASGRTLAEFLEAEHRNSAALRKLRSALAALAAFLEHNNLAHGDIQPENVMVSADGATVQLIDYDGMFVESLSGAKATELGQLNFQHPQRSADNFSSTLDRFSFLTLDVALQALMTSPKIWATSRSEPSAVVFRRNDFINPGASAVFQEAVAIARLKSHVENLGKVAAGSFAGIPSLADFLQGKGIPAGPITVRPNNAVVVYQGPYVVCDAANYAQVLGMVGNRVELVGKIHSVRNGLTNTKIRRPYVFVNFSDWRGRAVKLAIWVDGIDAIKPHVPDASWVGRWVSVAGLVDPPYSRRGYTHLSITITAPGQLQQLPEKDAKFRLVVAGRPVAGGAPASNTRNSDILIDMGGKGASGKKRSPLQPPSPPPVQTRNQQLLTVMQRQTPQVSAPPQHAPPRSLPARPSPPIARPASSSKSGCLSLLILGGLVLLWRLVAG
ncbi:protein kinase family protein [Xanthomonas sacchari]